MPSRLLKTLAFAGLLCSGSVALAEDSASPAGFWVTPTIEGFGKMHELPTAAYRPQAGKTYKVVFALTKAPRSRAEVRLSTTWHAP